jgi:hypothetical protein
VKSIIIIIFAVLLFAGCNSNNPVTNTTTNTGNYSKISTIEQGSVKYEIWSASAPTLIYGYNDIGFKVFINGTEKTTGFVKILPKMYHFVGSLWHSSPVSSSFNYNSDNGLFTGYASFIMVTDSNGFWYNDFNYNNESYLDSMAIIVNSNSTSQVRVWDDIVGGHSYVLTLIEPNNAKVGLNNLTYLLHQTNNDKDYVEISTAEVLIRPWMPSHGHGSSSNVNPAPVGGGKYTGKANFTMSGGWYVYDSINYNGGALTSSSSPDFYFDVH